VPQHARHVIVALALLPSVVALSVGWVGAEPAAEVLRFAGCDANIPITRVLAQAFRRTRPHVSIHFETVGSTNGIALAAAGVVHVGLVSRSFHDGEEGQGLTFRAYARTAVVIGADPNLPAISLSSSDLLALYRGTKLRWVGGRDVALLTREEGDSSVVTLKRTLAGFADAYAEGATRHHWTVLYDEPTMHEALLTFPFALGLSDLGTITTERLPIKALVIDGVAPTLENVARGRYPLTKTLALVWRDELLPPSARAFVEFVRSAEAAGILTSHGYLPVD
jgi:phosphate transport system substrate-binding protein